jgi:hypothetical protein
MANFLSRLLRAGASTRAPSYDHKASRTGPLIAHLTYGGARYAPRDAVELTRLGYPSPRDSGYAVAYDLLGMKASFLVRPAPERIELMICEEAPPAPPLHNPEEMTPFDHFASLMTALQRRVPHVPVILAPTSVQGAGAAREIIQALEALYALSGSADGAGPDPSHC